jgi:ketosteroid isomerase-like protein
MSQENVELVRRGFEHLLTTGEPLWASIAPDIVVQDHHSPDQDVYEGHAGLGQWLGDWDAAWDEWSIELDRLVDAGDSVVAIYRMRVKGKGSGVELDVSEAQVWEIRGARAVRLHIYGTVAEALEAVGLSEQDAHVDT